MNNCSRCLWWLLSYNSDPQISAQLWLTASCIMPAPLSNCQWCFCFEPQGFLQSQGRQMIIHELVQSRREKKITSSRQFSISWGQEWANWFLSLPFLWSSAKVPLRRFPMVLNPSHASGTKPINSTSTDLSPSPLSPSSHTCFLRSPLK